MGIVKNDWGIGVGICFMKLPLIELKSPESDGKSTEPKSDSQI
jgi:hypothetical protein